MKKLTILMSCLLINIGLKAQGVQFLKNSNLKEITTMAQSLKRYIMIDAYTTWCVPCREMVKNTFPDYELGTYLGENFLSLQIQIDRTTSDSDSVKLLYDQAKEIAEKYEVSAFPTILFLSPEGKFLSRSVGFKSAKELLLEAKKAIQLDGEYGIMLNKFHKGLLDTAQLHQLASKAMEIRDDEVAFKSSEVYLKRLKRSELFTKNNLLFIGKTLSSKSRYFPLFFNHPETVNKIIYDNFAEGEVIRVLRKEEIEPYTKVDSVNWDMIESRTISKYGDLGAESVWGSRLVYYSVKEDWENFAKYYKLYFERSIPHGRSYLHINNLSWPVVEHISDHSVMTVALKALEFSIDKFDRYEQDTIDTYANLLYKLGRIDEAIAWEGLAVRLSNNAKEFVETLEKMKRNEILWPVRN